MNKIFIILFMMASQSISAAEFNSASAILKDLKGKKIGSVKFDKKNNILNINVHIKGFEENSKHGIHIHAKGVCEGNFDSSGPHFDPTNEDTHGRIQDHSHYGDLGNISANDKGVVEAKITSSKLSLGDGDASIVGRSIIIHEDLDDGKSQPAGNSGKRIGCGIIKGES